MKIFSTSKVNSKAEELFVEIFAQTFKTTWPEFFNGYSTSNAKEKHADSSFAPSQTE